MSSVAANFRASDMNSAPAPYSHRILQENRLGYPRYPHPSPPDDGTCIQGYQTDAYSYFSHPPPYAPVYQRGHMQLTSSDYPMQGGYSFKPEPTNRPSCRLQYDAVLDNSNDYNGSAHWYNELRRENEVHYQNLSISSVPTKNMSPVSVSTTSPNMDDSPHLRKALTQKPSSSDLQCNLTFGGAMPASERSNKKNVEPDVFNLSQFHGGVKGSLQGPIPITNERFGAVGGVTQASPTSSMESAPAPQCQEVTRVNTDDQTDFGESEMAAVPAGAVTYPWMKTPGNNKEGCKRTRQTYTHYQTLELEFEFRLHKYLVSKKRAEIANKLSLTERQVKTWFQNRRMKEKKEKALRSQNNYMDNSVSSPEMPQYLRNRQPLLNTESQGYPNCQMVQPGPPNSLYGRGYMQQNCTPPLNTVATAEM